MAKPTNWHPREYASLADIHAELDRFDVAHRAGTIRTTGNWSEGQILEHCSIPIGFAIDGWKDEQGQPIIFPAHLRIVGALLLKPTIGRMKFKPGIKVPGGARSLLPQPEQDFEIGLSKIRTQMARLDAGERMTQPSPLFGKMSHDKWTKLHLDHCRLHFGFIHCD